ncbi:hypothetical protein NLJ89_g5075 [Agrocybe chaxingu]|uniref:Thiaminase-2/PQQC domain-containing protein n=1 Tax=Agrocybe chaxingu TaxID=84603 RepID=A0A9W8K0W2_9AGAR|nr:hypothetical protein NLJ89_g5075 [Agrocybe chaxingu]
MTTPSLTNHLLSFHRTPEAYTAATQHPFLTQAGDGTLPPSRLALWLSQDRIYAAHAYPRFIGSLVARIPFCEKDAISSSREKQNEDILKMLVGCLDNILREVDFFRDTAETYGLDVEGWVERKGTRDYTAEMCRISSNGSLEDGLIFLWAMEQVYLDAWSYVKDRMHSIGAPQTSASAIDKFATNWSSTEFRVFVNALADLVDGLGVKPGTDEWHRGETIWERVIELEIGFWPEEGEEATLKHQFSLLRRWTGSAILDVNEPFTSNKMIEDLKLNIGLAYTQKRQYEAPDPGANWNLPRCLSYQQIDGASDEFLRTLVHVPSGGGAEHYHQMKVNEDLDITPNMRLATGRKMIDEQMLRWYSKILESVRLWYRKLEDFARASHPAGRIHFAAVASGHFPPESVRKMIDEAFLVDDTAEGGQPLQGGPNTQDPDEVDYVLVLSP